MLAGIWDIRQALRASQTRSVSTRSTYDGKYGTCFKSGVLLMFDLDNDFGKKSEIQRMEHHNVHHYNTPSLGTTNL